MTMLRSRNTERDRLADELAGLRADIKALTTQRDRTAELNALNEQVERLRLEKAGLVEANDRKIRETEHRVGLLKTKQDHDVEHARRMAQLEVREANLDADRERFQAEMAFQREHMQREVDRFDGIAKALMERLPTIEVDLSGQARTSKQRGRSDDLD